MQVILALAAALLFTLGTVLQQRAGLQAPGSGSAGLLMRMARQPVWLAGLAADAAGFVAHAAALTVGQLSVVQPLLVVGLVFALPLGARLTGQVVRRADVAAAVAVTAALGAFLVLAAPSGGRDDATPAAWLAAGLPAALACGALVLAARRAGPACRAALLGMATGVLFAFCAALTKTVGDRLGDGFSAVLADWHLYALAGTGFASMTLSQLSLQTGRLAPAVATATALDPLVSVLLGTALLSETLHAGPAATAALLLVLAGGIAVLARPQAYRDDRAPIPAPMASASRCSLPYQSSVAVQRTTPSAVPARTTASSAERRRTPWAQRTPSSAASTHEMP